MRVCVHLHGALGPEDGGVDEGVVQVEHERLLGAVLLALGRQQRALPGPGDRAQRRQP